MPDEQITHIRITEAGRRHVEARWAAESGDLTLLPGSLAHPLVPVSPVGWESVAFTRRFLDGRGRFRATGSVGLHHPTQSEPWFAFLHDGKRTVLEGKFATAEMAMAAVEAALTEETP